MKNKMPFVYLLAMKPALAEAFSRAFRGAGGVEIAREDFASFMNGHSFVTGIVSPANRKEYLEEPQVKTFRTARQINLV